jgi:hypothetical protein
MKILPVALFRKLVPGSPMIPVTIKIVPKAACDPIVLKAVHWRKLTNAREGKLKQKLIRLSEQSLELVSVFKDASRNCIFKFLFNKAGKEFEQHL